MNSIICYHIWLEGRMVAINIATNHLRRFNPSCYKSIWNILCTSLPLSLWSELFLRKNLILVFCVVLSGWEQWAVEPTKEKNISMEKLLYVRWGAKQERKEIFIEAVWRETICRVCLSVKALETNWIVYFWFERKIYAA